MKLAKLWSLLLPVVIASGCAMSTAPSGTPVQASQEAPAASDAAITTRVKAALAADADLAGFKIDVDTKSGTVILNGEIKSMVLRRKTEAIATGVSGVKAVDNRLVITG